VLHVLVERAGFAVTCALAVALAALRVGVRPAVVRIPARTRR
jgi:hypothetical protein